LGVQGIDDFDGGLRVLHHQTFGDFHLQVLRRKAGFGEQGADLFSQAMLTELGGGKIHRDGQRRQPGVLPGFGLFECFAQHPGAEAENLPA
jgi:hypothetical protein